jgi:hypothetical protein
MIYQISTQEAGNFEMLTIAHIKVHICEPFTNHATHENLHIHY